MVFDLSRANTKLEGEHPGWLGGQRRSAIVFAMGENPGASTVFVNFLPGVQHLSMSDAAMNLQRARGCAHYIASPQGLTT
jgi:hypothetical protein